MIAPFFLGMVIHFVLPLEFILEGHSRVEESYNLGKTLLEQNTVRALSILNSKLLGNKLQIYSNIRSSLARVIPQENLYYRLDATKIILNSAYALAQSQQ